MPDIAGRVDFTTCREPGESLLDEGQLGRLMGVRDDEGLERRREIRKIRAGFPEVAKAAFNVIKGNADGYFHALGKKKSRLSDLN